MLPYGPFLNGRGRFNLMKVHPLYQVKIKLDAEWKRLRGTNVDCIMEIAMLSCVFLCCVGIYAYLRFSPSDNF